MAGCPILKEVLRPVVPHPEQKLVLQHGDTAMAVHSHLGQEKVEGASALLATKAPTHHDIPDGVALHVSVRCTRLSLLWD